jgi:hypothetical protein
MREISNFILYKRLIPRLRSAPQLDMFETLAAATMDYVAGYMYIFHQVQLCSRDADQKLQIRTFHRNRFPWRYPPGDSLS